MRIYGDGLIRQYSLPHEKPASRPPLPAVATSHTPQVHSHHPLHHPPDSTQPPYLLHPHHTHHLPHHLHPHPLNTALHLNPHPHSTNLHLHSTNLQLSSYPQSTNLHLDSRPQSTNLHLNSRPQSHDEAQVKLEYEYSSSLEQEVPHLQLSQEQIIEPSQHQQQQQGDDHQKHQQQQYPDMVELMGLGSSFPPQPTSPSAHRPLANGDVSNKDAVGMGVRDDPIDGGEEEEHDGLDEEVGKGSMAGGNRWPRQETLALLKIRSDMDSLFRETSSKGALWEDVSRKLAEMGYQRSSKKCKEKFENVHKYYKRTRSTGAHEGKSYHFYSQLESLYESNKAAGSKSGNINSLINGNGTLASKNTNANGALLSTTTSIARPVAVNTNGVISVHGAGLRLELDIGSGLNFSSGTNSDDDSYDDGEIGDSRGGDNTGGGGGSKKRKWRSMKKCLLFFQCVVEKVLEKQERMQQKLLETLERQDEDRMAREEAWKRQEMARFNRENDQRAQERALSASRDAALVAFLQKITGETFHLAPPTTTPIIPMISHDTNYEDYARDNDFSNDPSSKKWPTSEVLALIKLRKGLDHKFHEPGSKVRLWEEISEAMGMQGYTSKTAKKCKEKWENINKYFKRAKESKKKRPDNGKTCPYFHHLDALYKEGTLGTNTHININSEQIHLDMKGHDDEPIKQGLMLQQANNLTDTREDEDSVETIQEDDSEIVANTNPTLNKMHERGVITSSGLPPVHSIISPNGDMNGTLFSNQVVETKANQLVTAYHSEGFTCPPACDVQHGFALNSESRDRATSSINQNASTNEAQVKDDDMQFAMG